MKKIAIAALLFSSTAMADVTVDQIKPDVSNPGDYVDKPDPSTNKRKPKFAISCTDSSGRSYGPKDPGYELCLQQSERSKKTGGGGGSSVSGSVEVLRFGKEKN